jgi:hypothetical protein
MYEAPENLGAACVQVETGDRSSAMMTKDDNQNTKVLQYNNDTFDALTKSLTMGSMRRPRSTLADLAGLEVNDNRKEG